MSSVESQIDELLRLDPKQYGFVETISMSFRDGDGYELSMKLRPHDLARDDRLELTAQYVSNVQLVEQGHWEGGVLISVEDLSSSQWDRCRFRFFDSENDAISFYCGEFSVTVRG